MNSFSDLSLLHLLRLSSPSLPIGAFSYSQGLEYAIEANWVHDADSLRDWVSGILRNTHRYVDLPILQRSYHAWKQQDYTAVHYWNDRILAQRETSELLEEDLNLGRAMKRLLTGLNVNLLPDNSQVDFAFAILFALSGLHWQIELRSLCTAYCWSWSENQIAAAIKSFPLGQTQGQRILCDLSSVIVEIVDQSFQLSDEEIGASCFGASLASMLHETQYSRLFRS